MPLIIDPKCKRPYAFAIQCQQYFQRVLHTNNNNMMSDAADAVTAEYATAMEEAIAAAVESESKCAAAEALAARLQAALSAVTTATENMHAKASDLYWLGRRNIEQARHGPGGPAIERIMSEHEEEADKIASGDTWEHGYWAGTLAVLRLAAATELREYNSLKQGEIGEKRHLHLTLLLLRLRLLPAAGSSSSSGRRK
jgi:hypothetical protein